MSKLKLAVLLLLFVNFILAGKVIPLPDLQKAEDIIVDQNKVLITQFPLIYIYSLKDFSLITKFGKAGDGPEEFSRYIRIRLTPDHIVVDSNLKMSFFTHDGKFVKEIRSPAVPHLNWYTPLGKKIVATALHGMFTESYQTVNIFDSNLEKIKEVIRWKRPLQPGKFNPTDRDMQGGEFTVYDNKIFVLLREKGNIEVFADDGKQLYSINYDYEKIPFTKDDEKEFLDFYKVNPETRQFFDILKKRFDFPDYYPVARQMVVTGDKIYVLTNKTKEKKSEFVIFDISGKFLKKVMLPFANTNAREPSPFTIHNEELLQLIDNEKTEVWELHFYPIK